MTDTVKFLKDFIVSAKNCIHIFSTIKYLSYNKIKEKLDEMFVPTNERRIVEEGKKSKQVIVVRTDLKMPDGKMAAQACHASLACFLKMGKKTEYGDSKVFTVGYNSDDELGSWIDKKFTKIVLGVNSLEELEEMYKKAEDAGLVCSIIKDAADTFFKKPTITCIGIGPHQSDRIDKITGKLRLYKII